MEKPKARATTIPRTRPRPRQNRSFPVTWCGGYAESICICGCHPDATTRLTAGTDGRAVAQRYPQPAAAAGREAEACHDQSGSATLHERYVGHRVLTRV